MGNICRSPTAEGVFRERVRQAGLERLIEIDSAGTHAYHVGEPPDSRAIAHAAKRGYDLRKLRARRIKPEDFGAFDYVLAMDESNLAAMMKIRPADAAAETRLFLDYAGADVPLREVPDPYYGGAGGFEQVLDLVESAADGLLAVVQNRLTPKRQ
ncbi:MAG: low molecular weight phosphotyrosine protein phosphatase [Burkholderiales bacterium]|nr:low molecular weight phosphotyrosine protein phosphatase [Burkholderiales bacterium]